MGRDLSFKKARQGIGSHGPGPLVPQSRQPPYLKESADIQTPFGTTGRAGRSRTGRGSGRTSPRATPAAEKPLLEIPGSRLSSSGVDAVMKSDRSSSSSSAPKNANFIIKTVHTR